MEPTSPDSPTTDAARQLMHSRNRRALLVLVGFLAILGFFGFLALLSYVGAYVHFSWRPMPIG